MQVRRRRGRLRLEFDADDAQVLESLFTQLLDLLDEDGAGAGGAADDSGDAEVLARLFPDGHRDDPEISAEFRELTRQTLGDERRARIEACRTDLAGDGVIDVADAEATQRWMQVLNDLRLAIGTRLGVGQDEPQLPLDRAHPDVPRMIYHWLTEVQDTLVVAVMR